MNRVLLAEGGSAEVFEWSHNMVVKLFRREFASTAAVEAEKAYAIYEAGVSSPQCYGLVTIEDRPGIVYERVLGVPLYDQLRGRPEAASEVGRILAYLHRNVHAYEVDKLDDLLDIAEHAVGNFSIVKQGAIRSLIGQLPRGKTLHHGDFQPGNILMANCPVIIDWGTAFSSHPALDVARSSILMRFQGKAKSGSLDDQVRENEIRRTVSDSYIDHYISITTVTRDEIRLCEAFYAEVLLSCDSTNENCEELQQIAAAL